MTGAPAAKANAVFLAVMKLGAFHGAITAVGPHASRCNCAPDASCSNPEEFFRCVAALRNRSGSPPAKSVLIESGRPLFLESSRAIAAVRSSTSSAVLSSRRTRSATDRRVQTPDR